MSTFNDQSMSIGCVSKLGCLSGFLRHYRLILRCLNYKRAYSMVLPLSIDHTYLSHLCPHDKYNFYSVIFFYF